MRFPRDRILPPGPNARPGNRTARKGKGTMLRLVSSLALLLVATPIQAATVVWSISGTIAQVENSSG